MTSTTHSHHTAVLVGRKVAHLEFKNYEKKIVEKLGVVIEGWTCPDFISPSHFKKVSQVEELYHVVNSGACKARKLSDLELTKHKKSNQAHHALGEAVYGTTKKGTKCKATGDGAEQEGGEGENSI